MNRFLLLSLFLWGATALAEPSYVATFQSIGLYWSPPGADAGNPARVEFREQGASSWRRGLDLWFDSRNAEYRGSLVELEAGTSYEIRLTLATGFKESLRARTWRDDFPVKKTIRVPPGTKRLVIEAADSGSEREGYVVFTAPPGRNVIDQSSLSGNGPHDSCVVVKQGVHHVVIRGLVLRHCRRYGIYIERQYEPVLDAQTRDIVIEDNDIAGWGGSGSLRPGRVDNDGAVHCNYWRGKDDAKRPDRIVIQRNTMRDPRHGSNPWRSGAGEREHPMGPQGVVFDRCGRNHVIRHNSIYSRNGNYFMDGIGGAENFSHAGFPWADSDIHGNRISEAYDDGIEAEGANRNVRIWGNYLDRVFVAIANATTAAGPLYVWRNVSYRMGGMYHPQGPPDLEERGPFVKAGSRNASVRGGRAYYFHNTVLQPGAPGSKYAMGAGWGILGSGGTLYNFVSRNNIWHIHKPVQIHGERKFASISAHADRGPVDADFDLYNGPLWNAGRGAERRGWKAIPVFAASQPGDFSLAPGTPGHGGAEPIPNFNDRHPRPDVGAHQSGTPPMRFGRPDA
jgi:hypothetical protein